MAHLHLTVLQAHTPHQAAALGSPQRNEFVWNDDFTAFRVEALAWWDDQSYIDYQCRDMEYDAAEGHGPANDAELPAPVEPAVSQPCDEDEIPF